MRAGDVACLSDAIQASNQNGESNTVRLDAGTYVVAGPPGLPTIVGALAIIGAGTDDTIFERGVDGSRFTMIAVGPTGTLDLTGVTVRGAWGTAIGSSGTLRITNSVIRNTLGNALFVTVGELRVTDTRIIGNGAEQEGSVITLGCILACSPFNSPPLPVTISRSTISGNGALFGSAILIGPNARVSISDSALANNSTVFGIAGIEVRSLPAESQDRVVITNTTVSGHSGGGTSGSSMMSSATAISGSMAVLINNSTITNNASGVVEVRIQNSIVAGNHRQPGDTRPGFGDCALVVSLGHNLFGDPVGCGAIASDLTGDPGLGAFVDGGRPGAQYFPLLASSQAIDAGDPAACASADQRGLARDVDGNGDGLRACDIGAVESYPVVNDALQLEGVQSSFIKPSNLGFTDPRASAGAYRITAFFKNTGPDICHVAFDVAALDGPPDTKPVLLTNAGELLGGQGAAIPATKGGAPADLLSASSVGYQFTIGVQQRTGINFMVNALGDATSGPCAP